MKQNYNWSILKEKDMPVFIVGSGRCGTTMLAKLLNMLPELSMRREVGLMGNTLLNIPNFIWQKYRSPHLLEKLSATNLREYNMDMQMFNTLIKKSKTRKDFLVNFYFSHGAKPGALYWGENTPGDSIALNHIYKQFPSARFIHIYRDPRDVTISYINQDFGPGDIKGAACLWLVRIRSIFSFKKTNQILSLRYEDFVKNPVKQMGLIGRFLKLRELTKGFDTINKLQIGKWKRVKKFNFDIILKICGSEMQKLGYIETDPYPHYFLYRFILYWKEIIRIKYINKIRTSLKAINLHYKPKNAQLKF